MRRFQTGNALAILLLSFSTLLSAAPQEPSNRQPPATTALPTYPESSDGLKKLTEDIFGAMKSGDNKRTSTYFLGLTIPDHNAWFLKTFGAVEGPRLAARYRELLPKPPDDIKKHFEYALKGDRTTVEVTLLQNPVETSASMSRAILEAMVDPIRLYSASGTSPKEQYAASIGDFTYVDGAFRYIDPEVFRALSAAPPPRIRVGGNTQANQIIHKVSPIYPSEARAAGTEGTVVLHVVIGADGKLRETTPVSGDPALAKAAVDAVSQWQYRPTLLKGIPAEVDTTVTVDFRLK